MKNAIQDLMDRQPYFISKEEPDPFTNKVQQFVNDMDWVKKCSVRFSDHGQVFFGEVFVVCEESNISVELLEQTTERIKQLDWKLFDIVMVPVTDIRTPESVG